MIKKYKQFIKEDFDTNQQESDLANRDLEDEYADIPDDELDIGYEDQDGNAVDKDGNPSLEEPPSLGNKPFRQDDPNASDFQGGDRFDTEEHTPLEEEGYEGEEEEDEGDVYINSLQDLANELGNEVVDKAIQYEGKTIIFPSETEKFHVDRKKFNTLEEVLKYLKK